MVDSVALANAKMAVAFVKQIVVHGADNVPGSATRLKKKHPGKVFNIDETRERRMDAVPLFYGPDPFSWIGDFRNPLSERWLMDTVVDAMATGQGRCGEQAAVAYYYLVKKKNLTGVGVFMVKALGDPDDTSFDHTFVVLGLDREPVARQVLSPAHIPTGWTNAVWCDPWADHCFEIKKGWPRDVDDVLGLVPDYAEAKRRGIELSCRYYHGDRDQAFGHCCVIV